MRGNSPRVEFRSFRTFAFYNEDWPVKEFYKALPRELPVCWFDLQSTISGVRLTGQAVTKKEGRRKNVEVAVRMLNDFLSEFKVGTAVIYGPRGKRAQELLDAADFPQGTKIILCPAWRQANQDDGGDADYDFGGGGEVRRGGGIIAGIDLTGIR